MLRAFSHLVVVEGDLRFENFALGGGELELDWGDHFTRAFAHAVIAQACIRADRPSR